MRVSSIFIARQITEAKQDRHDNRVCKVFFKGLSHDDADVGFVVFCGLLKTGRDGLCDTAVDVGVGGFGFGHRINNPLS